MKIKIVGMLKSEPGQANTGNFVYLNQVSQAPPRFTSIWVCDECFQVIANHDYTGLDYYTTPDYPTYADDRKKAIDAGLERLGWVYVGDSNRDKGDEGESQVCACCGCDTYQTRHCQIDASRPLTDR